MSELAVEEGEERLVCVVEIPKGGRNKYEYDPELGGIKFDRLLASAATYPLVSINPIALSAITDSLPASIWLGPGRWSR